MKKLNILMLVLTFVVVPVTGCVGNLNSSKSNASKSSNKTSVITGKILRVDEEKRVFTLSANGTQYSFVFPKSGKHPKAGETVEVTYHGALGGPNPAEAVNLNSSRSNW
jgi:hypothetical protein